MHPLSPFGKKPRIRLVPYAHMEKLKKTPVLIGHERCASSQFCDTGTLIICASHGHGWAQNILRAGTHYQGCRDCIEELCRVVPAKTHTRPRGPYVDIEP